MLSCEDLIEELGSYLDDELTPEQRRQLEEHLSDCRPCEVIADSARKTVRIVTGCKSFELPPKMSARIMSKIRSTCTKGKGDGS